MRRDRENSRGATDETEEWEEKENQRLFKKEEERIEIDDNIPKELGVREPQIEKSGLFGMKKKLVAEYHDE